jgi:hypothetical protein
MSFLAPWILYGLGAISLPILIHLWQRRRVVEVPISTLRFLKAIAARTSRSSKLENLLLLLLRCLLFALVILAAARPVMLAKTAKFMGGDIPRTLVLVIDNSASMGYGSSGQTRLEAAKSCALALLEDLKQGDKVAVIAAASDARMLVAEPTIDRAVAQKVIAGIQLTQDRSDFAISLHEAGKILAKTERGIRQIFFFTDSQETGWRSTLANPGAVFDTTWQQTGPQLVVVRPDDVQANNACIKQLRINTPLLTPGSTVRGVATLENFSAAPLRDLLSVFVGSERVAQKPAEVSPNGSIEVPFEFVAPQSMEGSSTSRRWVKAKASVFGDNLPGDDSFFFTMPVYLSPRVLLVEGIGTGPERLRPGFFLRKALSVGTENPIELRTISASQLEETPIENQSAVFLADPGRLGDRSVVRLERFLQAGGTIVLFPGDQSRLADFDNLEFLPGKPTAMRNLAAGRQPVKIANPNHPLFSDSWDSGLPFPALPQQRLLEWKVKPNAQVMLGIGSAGNAFSTPFLIYQNVSGGGAASQRLGSDGASPSQNAYSSSGHCLVVNASADRSWGDFPLSPAFVPLVQQIARFSASQWGHSQPLTVGDPIPLPPSLPRDKTISLTFPDGRKQPVSPRPSQYPLVERAELPGFYEPAVGDQKTVVPVNIDRQESNLSPVGPGALEKCLPHSELVNLVGVAALRQWLSQSKGMAPVWPLLLLAALALFLLEGVLSNLVAGRRSQGEQKQIALGRLNRRRVGVPFYGAIEPEREKTP